MPEIIRSCDQNSDEWFSLRLASIGGTAINYIAPKGKGYKDTLYKLAGEMLTGVKTPSNTFRDADRGHEYEPYARQLYEIQTGSDVEQVALIKGRPHNHISPDGLIGKDTLLEIKVRYPHTWLPIAEGGLEPIADRRQRQWGLYVSERAWYNSVNYCPELADAGKESMIISRIGRDEKMIRELKTIAGVFIVEMMAMVKKYGG